MPTPGEWVGDIPRRTISGQRSYRQPNPITGDSIKAKKAEQFTRIAYSTPTGSHKGDARAARKRPEAAVQAAIEEFHNAGRSIESVEMYPYDGPQRQGHVNCA